MSTSARLLAWGRLARLSLAPSALADVAAGLLLGGGGAWPASKGAAVALGASACVYHGGMVLNDWADRGEDARSRPDRPLPSGKVAPTAALVVGATLIVGAIALAWCVGPRAAAWMAGLALLVLAYDFLGRGRWVGPALLGACRATNLGFGWLAARELGSGEASVESSWGWAFLALYFVYVASVSAVARLEDAASDDEVGQTPRIALAVAALSVLAVAWLSPSSGVRVAPLLSLLLSLLGAFALLREAARRKSWTRTDAGRATGLGLRRLLVFSALVALASAPSLRDASAVFESPSGLAAALILCGFPLSAALRRVFPPT